MLADPLLPLENRERKRSTLGMVRLLLLSLLTWPLLSCLNGYTAHVGRVREALIGLEARELSRCLPVPQDVQSRDERERMIFHWAVSPEEEAEPTPGLERWQRERSERLDGPTATSWPARAGRRDADSAGWSVEPERPLGYCQLVFDLHDGVVTDVEADARDADGLSWDSGCLLLAEECVRDVARP